LPFPACRHRPLFAPHTPAGAYPEHKRRKNPGAPPRRTISFYIFQVEMKILNLLLQRLYIIAILLLILLMMIFSIIAIIRHKILSGGTQG
jgi:hypothetical protein